MKTESRQFWQMLGVAGWSLVMPAVPALVPGAAGASLAALGLSLGFVVLHVLCRREVRLAQRSTAESCPMRSLVPPMPEGRQRVRN